MFAGNEYDHLRNLAKSLHEQMGITELSLLTFNDEFKKAIFKKYREALLVNPNIDVKPTLGLASAIGNMQSEYIKFKVLAEDMLSLTEL
jgi:hypothetical protein